MKRDKKKNLTASMPFLSLFRLNLRFRMVLSFTLTLFLAIMLTAGVMYYGGSAYIYRASSDELVKTFASYAEEYRELSTEERIEVWDIRIKNSDLTIEVRDADGEILEIYPADGETFVPIKRNYNWFQDGHFFPDLSYREDIKGNTLILTRNMDSLTDKITLMLLPLGGLIFILLILSIYRIRFTTDGFIRPLITITEEVKEIARHSPEKRINLSGTKDELQDLAYTFNSLLDDLSQRYSREQQFVSDVSHELRTPISVIKGYADLLKRWGKDDPAVLEESVLAISQEAESMQSLIESLLLLARRDSGRLQMEMKEFDLTALLEDIERETQLIDTSHIFIFEVKKSVRQYGSADHLKQAIRILMDNAIKYTPEKGIIQVELKQSGLDNIISVSDTGRGIAQKDLPHVFDRFYRGDPSRTKESTTGETKKAGTGLGLAIAESIVDYHDGRILVESMEGVGSKFSIFIPQHPTVNEKRKKPTKRD